MHVYLVVIPEKKTDRQIPGKYNIETIAVPLWNELNIGIETKISNFLRHFFFYKSEPTPPLNGPQTS